MGNEPFDESLRRALGVPTKAELKAKAEQEARREKELMADQPRRHALAESFKREIQPIIENVVAIAVPVLEEARLALAAYPQLGSLSEEVIHRVAFQIVGRPAAPRVPGITLSPLCFDLLASGGIRVWTQPVNSAPPTHTVQFTTCEYPTARLDEAAIQSLLVAYVKAAKQVVKNEGWTGFPR